MTRKLLPVLLLLPGLALAQDLRSGPNAPAASAQPPPSSLPNEGGDRSGANAQRGQGAPGTQQTDHVRTAPPPGHQVLGGPPVPGATQPQSSEGVFTNRDRIPPNVGGRPDASTTGR